MRISDWSSDVCSSDLNSLCLTYDDLGGGRVPGNPNLDKAIDACSKGTLAAPYSLTGPTNLIVLKTRRGVATKADWDRYLEHLQRVTMNPENRQVIWIIIDNVRRSEEHTSELQSLMRISYAVFCLKKQKT